MCGERSLRGRMPLLSLPARNLISDKKFSATISTLLHKLQSKSHKSYFQKKWWKRGEKPTWEERLRLVSRALGGTAGGTRILRRSGGWRGVCKRENTVKRGAAKGNTLWKRGLQKGIHYEKGVCKREYTVKRGSAREYIAKGNSLQKGTQGSAKGYGGCYTFKLCFWGLWSLVRLKVKQSSVGCRNKGTWIRFMREKKIRKQCSWDSASVWPAGCSCRWPCGARLESLWQASRLSLTWCSGCPSCCRGSPRPAAAIYLINGTNISKVCNMTVLLKSDNVGHYFLHKPPEFPSACLAGSQAACCAPPRSPLTNRI